MVLTFIVSCKSKQIDYVDYYNKTLAIDSILRYQKDTLTAIKKYKKHFKKYGIQNQERLREFEIYALLCHKKNKDFGGKKALLTLIGLIEPYKERYKDLSFFNKYGLDSLAIVEKYKLTQSSYNKILIDSFKIARLRDQSSQKGGNTNTNKIANLNNMQLFKWSFAKYGFPSTKKVGSLGVWYDSSFYELLFMNLFKYPEGYNYLQENLKPYIKSGECNPYSYAVLVDRYYTLTKKNESYYSVLKTFNDLSHADSLLINKHRKEIGLPQMSHSRLIPTDRLQILKL